MFKTGTVLIVSGRKVSTFYIRYISVLLPLVHFLQNTSRLLSTVRPFVNVTLQFWPSVKVPIASYSSRSFLAVDWPHVEDDCPATGVCVLLASIATAHYRAVLIGRMIFVLTKRTKARHVLLLCGVLVLATALFVMPPLAPFTDTDKMSGNKTVQKTIFSTLPPTQAAHFFLLLPDSFC
jgi:hypothetical protein